MTSSRGIAPKLSPCLCVPKILFRVTQETDARSLGHFRRFYHVINADNVLGIQEREPAERLAICFSCDRDWIYFDGTTAIASTSTNIPGQASWLTLTNV